VVCLLTLAACHDSRGPHENGQIGGESSQITGDAGWAPDAAGDAGGLAEDAAVDASADAEPAAPISKEGLPGLCARRGDDAVRDIFCADADAGITSLRQLAARVQLMVLRNDVDEAKASAVSLDPDALINTAVILGHSTALSGQVVSPINPRAILLNSETFLAFQRGVQQVELITLDREQGKQNFYLVTFNQACNERAEGCRPGDLYTLSIERDWRSVTVQDDEDLKNTPSDCRQCHQRGREAGLLMRELQGPWTHFFGAVSSEDPYYQGDADLANDYRRAKGSESYAGLPAAALNHTAGFTLQTRVDPAQPIEFEAPEIEAELIASGSARRSATWDSGYAAFKRGEQMALPYFELRPTDAAKQAALSAAYARYRAGELSADQLPDLGDIFPNDPQTRAEIGLQTEPSATPVEALIQACASCHNDILDQTISRARFNVALARMSRAELDLAITRIETPAGQAGAMPPAGTRQLDPESKKRLLSYLKQQQRPAGEDAQLENVAKLGMVKERAKYPRL
jgi:mono/diheme cytochrome c family protein